MNEWVASGFSRKGFLKIFRLKAEATRTGAGYSDALKAFRDKKARE
ncbi:MAG: hypothetical protein ACREUZ_15235 [Burkholderiales bacterium]